MRLPIVGQAYETRQKIFGADRMINLYPEQGGADTKTPSALMLCPGMAEVFQLATGEVRGMWVASTGMLFVVSANTFYKVNRTGEEGNIFYTPVIVGYITTSTGGVSMRDNGNDLLLVDGTKGYNYKFSDSSFVEVADADFPHGTPAVAYIDGYYIVSKPNSQEFVISGINDGYTWDALDVSTAEGKPDDLVCVFDDHRELWLFGSQSTEVFYNSGNVDFPFERISGAYIEHGCVSPYCVAKIDNSVFWLSSDTNGTGIVYRANGYQPVRVSNHAIEAQIERYGDLSSTKAFAYQEDGHSFYVLIFPSAKACWVFDAATGAWHERSGWDGTNFVQYRANCISYANASSSSGRDILAGDFLNGKVYRMSKDLTTDAGFPMKWVRSFRVPNDENKIHFYGQLEIDMQTGGEDSIQLRHSNDGGKTWSAERTASSGGEEDEVSRVIYRRLGSARDRVFEVSGYTTGPICIVGAYARAK